MCSGFCWLVGVSVGTVSFIQRLKGTNRNPHRFHFDRLSLGQKGFSLWFFLFYYFFLDFGVLLFFWDFVCLFRVGFGGCDF